MDEQDQDQETTDDNNIPEEEVSQQEIIPFMGDELAAALTPGGIVYISLPGVCKALGLTVQPQMLRIKRTRSLLRGLRQMPLSTRGGSQRTYCLRVDKVALWLGGIETTRMRNEEFRLKIDAYQEELAPAATQVFMRVAGLRTRDIISSSDPQIIALADQVDTLTEITTLVREHMETLLEAQGRTSMQLEQAVHLLEALTNRQDVTEDQVAKIDERTKRLTTAHGKTVQETVNFIAVALEKQSPNITSQLAHSIIYGRLKKRFRARSYIEIPDERFDEVMSYLRQEYRRITGGDLPEQGNLF
jgi:P22_AR N-terminal domain/ORF6C domain